MMPEEMNRIYDLNEGILCLDYANTVGGSRYRTPRELMPAYTDLLNFSEQAGFISGKQKAELEAEAKREPEEAKVVYQRAIQLREALFRIFEAIASGKPAALNDLKVLNREVARTSSEMQIIRAGEKTGDYFPYHYEWAWSESPLTLDKMLGPIARSAGDLLVSDELNRVRECNGEDCTWLFVDRTRNRSRVWCDMKSCGNLAKVHRHRQRARMAKTAQE